MTRIPPSKRSASLRYYYRRRRKFELGDPFFTVAGLPRKRIFRYSTKAAKRRAANEQQRRWHAKKCAENRARGLTERGTIPINRIFPALRGLGLPKKEYQRRQYQILKAEKIERTRTPLEKAWRELRAEIGPILHVEDIHNNQLVGRKEIYE